MEKQRLDNIENTLSQLISMVGGMRAEMKQELTGVKEEQSQTSQEISGMKQEQASFKGELKSIREDLADSKKTSDKRHHEILNEFKIFRADHDHTWKKTVQNERDIAQLKSQYSN